MNKSIADSDTSITSNLDSILNQAVGIMDRLGSGFASYREKLTTLQARLGEGRFHLAVLGQFPFSRF